VGPKTDRRNNNVARTLFYGKFRFPKLFILYGEYCRARLFLTPLSERDITFAFVSSPRTFPRTLTIGTDDDYAKLRSRGFLIDRPYRVRRVLSTYFENSIRQSVRIWKIIAVRIRLHGREIGADVYYGSFFFCFFVYGIGTYVCLGATGRTRNRQINGAKNFTASKNVWITNVRVPNT